MSKLTAAIEVLEDAEWKRDQNGNIICGHDSAIRILEAAEGVDKEIADIAVSIIRRHILIKELSVHRGIGAGLEKVIVFIQSLPEPEKKEIPE